MLFAIAVSAQDKTWTGLWQQNNYEFWNSSEGSSTCFFAILDNAEEGLKVINFNIHDQDAVEVTILQRNQDGFKMKLYNPDNNFEVIWTCTVLDENTIKVQFQEIDSDWNGELTLERKRII